ncbi:hypothetical protein O9993_16065 [Vibrio lentus]|nr:hypothetical protein [Vibrio lentus]
MFDSMNSNRLLPFSVKSIVARQILAVARSPAFLAMGAISALVVSPCVSAPLAGALLYVSTTQD